MHSVPIQMPRHGSESRGFHRLQRTDSFDAHQLRPHSAPAFAAPIVSLAAESAWNFGCNASTSEQSNDEETFDQSVSASNEDTTSSSQEARTSTHYREFFDFLDDAHELGYVVKRPTDRQTLRSCAKSTHQLDLEQPSFERVNRNAVVLQHRYSYYDTLRRIDELRRKYGVKVSLEI